MDNLLCPITYEIMEDPVIAYDGHSYERKAIKEWYRLNFIEWNSHENIIQW